MHVRPLRDDDRPLLAELIDRAWGRPVVSVSGNHDPTVLPGLLAEERSEPVGILTYRIAGGECEVMTLNSLRHGVGAGRALMSAIQRHADDLGCSRVWLITSNDNIRAIRFYQQCGMDMVALHRDWVDVVRAEKPGVDASGTDGIPFRHAIEFAYDPGSKTGKGRTDHQEPAPTL